MPNLSFVTFLLTKSLPCISEITFKLEPKFQPYSISLFDLDFRFQDAIPISGHLFVNLLANFRPHFGAQIGPKTGSKNQKNMVHFWNPVFWGLEALQVPPGSLPETLTILL